MKEKTKLQNFFPWRKLCNTTSLHTGPRYFLYRMKKIQKSNESENRQMAFTCQLYKSRRTKTRQSNYKIWQNVKVLNSQSSMDSTLWILKKANSKMHALGRSVAIVYECGCVLAAHVSIMYTLQICLIGTNLKALAVFSWLFICYFVAIFNQGDTKYWPFF